MTSFCTVLRKDKRRFHRIIFLANLIMFAGLTGSTLGETRLNLTEAVDRALVHSYRIQAAQYDSATAQHDLRAASAERFPTLSLNATTYFLDEVQSVDLPVPTVAEMEIGSKENYQVDVKLNVPLFTGGKITAGINTRQAALAAQIAGLTAQRATIAYQCRSACFNLMIADGLVKSAEASLNRIIIIKNDVRNLHASGLADSVDLLDSELAYQTVKYQLETQKTNRANAALSLARLLGLTDNPEIVLTEDIPRPQESTLANISTADIQRHELAINDNRIRAAEYGMHLSSAAYFPTLAAFGGYSAGKPNRDMFGNDWNDYFLAGLNLNWSFNLGNKTGKSISAARQKVFSERMAKKELEESLLLQAQTALENVRHAYQAFIISEKEFAISREKYRLGLEKQRAGKMTVNRLLELEQELTATEQMHRVSMINYYLSENTLLYAVGSSRLFGGLSR